MIKLNQLILKDFLHFIKNVTPENVDIYNIEEKNGDIEKQFWKYDYNYLCNKFISMFTDSKADNNGIVSFHVINGTIHITIKEYTFNHLPHLHSTIKFLGTQIRLLDVIYCTFNDSNFIIQDNHEFRSCKFFDCTLDINSDTPIFSGCDFRNTYVNASKCELTDSILRMCEVIGASDKYSDMNNCSVHHSKLKNVDINDTITSNIKLTNGKITRGDHTNLQAHNVYFPVNDLGRLRGTYHIETVDGQVYDSI